MADWSAGYASTWRVTEVDPETWSDSGVLRGVRKMSVTKAKGDSSPLLEEGSVSIWTEDDAPPRVLRLWMTVDGSERLAVATLPFERSGGDTEAGWRGVTLQGRSVLAPAADVDLERGEYVRRGEDCAAWVARKLRSCLQAPVYVEGSFTLDDDYVFDLGSNNLDASWTLLIAGGWCIQVDGYGNVHVKPVPDVPALVLDRAHRGLLVPGVSDDVDLSRVPNRLRVVDADGTEAVAVNDDPASEVSYARRGRWVDAPLDDAPARRSGETLQAYADRRLDELSTLTASYRYGREHWNGVLPYDLVRCSLPADGLDGDLRVAAQDIACGRGIHVTETLQKEYRP